MTTITGKYGVGSSETLAGTAADDLFDSKGGDDRIDGGAGTDTAVFFDSKSNFTITTLSGITHITALPGASSQYYAAYYSPGAGVLTNIETIQFSDGSVNLNNGSYSAFIFGKYGVGSSETLAGTAADDLFDSKGGDDRIDGGAGTDTAVFFDSKSNFTITTLSGITHITALPGASSQYYAAYYSPGAGVLTNIEKIQFSDQTVWIGPADTSAPTVTSFTPADEATGVAVGINVLVTFSEAIARGTGNIVLKTSNGTTIATYDAATSSNLAISGSTLYLNPSADLTFSTGYTVEFAAGSVKDLAGNSFAGSASYNFTTQSVPAPLSFTSSSANEAFIGGAGTDTVIFNGSLANYSIAKQGSTYTVTNKAGADGTDTVTNIESLKFADMTVNLQVQSIAAATPLADVQRISELYVAFFNRTPDADGLAYWMTQKNSGQSISQISESFYNVGASPDFASLTGFSSSMTNEDFINVFYKNVLGRPEGADTGGLNYWNGKLSSGESTRSSLANDILSSAHAFKGDATWGWVADLLDNKVAVASKIAIEWGLTDNTNAYSKGAAIASAITSTDTAVALALVGVADADLNLG